MACQRCVWVHHTEFPSEKACPGGDREATRRRLSQWTPHWASSSRLSMIRTVFVMSLFTYTPLNLSFVLGFLALLSANGTRITLWNSMRIRLGLLLLFAKLILKKFRIIKPLSNILARYDLLSIYFLLQAFYSHTKLLSKYLFYILLNLVALTEAEQIGLDQNQTCRVLSLLRTTDNGQFPADKRTIFFVRSSPKIVRLGKKIGRRTSIWAFYILSFNFWNLPDN